MKKHSMKAFAHLGIAGLLLFGGNAWAGDDPSITRITVHDDNTATIYGANFFDKDEDESPGLLAPVVRIGWGTDDPDLTQLPLIDILSYDDNTITVALPGDLGPGDYKLSVANYYDAAGGDDGSSEEKNAAQYDLTVGAVGLTGDQGVQGKLGDTGPQGEQGKLGDTGAQGVQGKLGDTGAQGVQGKLGDTGAQGEQGKLGAQGEQGKLGAQGEQGKLGFPGMPGMQGIQGKLGPHGDQGEQGKLGAQGVQGKIGPEGPPGPADPLVESMLGDVKKHICDRLDGVAIPSTLPEQAADQCPSFCNPDTSCYVGVRTVFVTSDPTINGFIGGLTGADDICQAKADAAGLGGEYVAWLSTSTVDAKDRIPNAEYRRVDGAVVATSKGDLIDGSIVNPIEKDENGTVVAAFGVNGLKRVWTGTLSDGTVVPGGSNSHHCWSWDPANNTPPGVNQGLAGGWYGQSDTTDGRWTDTSGRDCGDAIARLYCFQTTE